MNMQSKNHPQKIALFTVAFLCLSLALPIHAESPIFQNPLQQKNIEVSVGSLIVRIIQFLLGLSAVIALLAVVIGGIRLTVGGFDNEQEAARAKKILTWAVVGFAITILSTTIITIVSRAIGLVN